MGLSAGCLTAKYPRFLLWQPPFIESHTAVSSLKVLPKLATSDMCVCCNVAIALQIIINILSVLCMYQNQIERTRRSGHVYTGLGSGRGHHCKNTSFPFASALCACYDKKHYATNFGCMWKACPTLPLSSHEISAGPIWICSIGGYMTFFGT